jgi:hypothetical protein
MYEIIRVLRLAAGQTVGDNARFLYAEKVHAV